MNLAFLALLPAALLIDRLFGELPSRVHPVCMMGALASRIEALGKRDGDAQGVFVKAPGRDADPDDDGRDEPCRPGVGVNLRGPRQPARESGAGQDDKIGRAHV